MSEAVTKDWHGLMQILHDIYPASVFDGSSGDPGPTIVVLSRRVDMLTKERDQAREEAGHLRAMKKYVDGEMRDYLNRLILAKKALVNTGYFTEDQVTVDIAPRITELWAAADGGRYEPTAETPSD